MYEEDEGNGRLMRRKAGTHPLIWARSVAETESIRHPKGAFEVSIVSEAPATNYLLAAQTEQHPHLTHTYTQVHAYLHPDTHTLGEILQSEK